MTRRLARTLAVLAALVVLSGHVGSPNVLFDGSAGPYPVRVIVRPPGVIPGLAEVAVRVSADGVRRVAVRPVRWDLGTAGAPRADEALPVPGDPALRTAQLWFMDFGSYSVEVTVEGAAGEGRVMVPIPARATEIREMPAGLGVGLAGLGLFLLVGLLTIVGAAVRESVLPPGEEPDPGRVRRSWTARAVAVPVLALLLVGGNAWWRAEDAAYAENLYRPLQVETTASATEVGRVLTLRVTDPAWAAGAWGPLLPDHGKLVHMFLVREPGLDAFAHVHPERVAGDAFRLPLPPLPAGRYRVYADVLHESGYPQTLVDTVEIPAPAGGPASLDADDAWLVAVPAPARAVRLADGSTLAWAGEETPLRAGRETTLAFRVTAPDGVPAALEPYLGMLSHAALAHEDGSVFVHLHPMGTVSTTSQSLFEQRERGDTARGPTGELLVRGVPAHLLHPTTDGVVSFPYEFPRPGRYALWVQVKRGGRVMTGAFELEVR